MMEVREQSKGWQRQVNTAGWQVLKIIGGTIVVIFIIVVLPVAIMLLMP